MSDELEPLGPLALRALAAEKGRGDIDAAMQERLLGRVVATVAVGAAVTAVAGSAAAAAGKAGPGAGAGAGGTSIAAGLTIKALPWIIGAFVAGGGTGAAIHAAAAPSSSSPPQPSQHVERAPSPLPVPSPLPDVSAAPSLSSMPVGSLPAAVSAAPPAPRPSASAAQGTAAGTDVDLASERALVDRARAALSRGQTRYALDALDTHTTRYPRGRLSEEREALAVDALARAGRLDDARARASRFHAAYPNSVFGGVVDAAIAPR